MSPAISIIIPTHNRAEILRHSLAHLFAQNIPQDAYEISVADDASDDNTREMVESLARPNLFYHRHEKNRGPGGARNTAIAATTGEILMILDDDSFVGRDFLGHHIAAHRGHEQLAITGPIVEVSSLPSLDMPPLGRFSGLHTNPFSTCNVSLKRAFFDRAGGFDEYFGVYGWEDTELHRRLLKLGVRRRFLRRAPVYHYKSAQTRQDFVRQLKREMNRGTMGAVFYAKHRDFAVGWQTKQWKFFYGLDHTLGKALGLERIAQRALLTGATPKSAFLRLLTVNHVEIASGEREWNRMGPEKRAALAAATAAMVKPEKTPHPACPS